MKILVKDGCVARTLPDDAELSDGIIIDTSGHEYGRGLVGFKLVSVPDQKLSTAPPSFDGEPLLIDARYPEDVVLFSAEELSERIDRKTGAVIRRNIHPLCGADESDAINRDQIVQILNHLGIEPTPEFAVKNEIAIAEIEKARLEKDAL